MFSHDTTTLMQGSSPNARGDSSMKEGMSEEDQKLVQDTKKMLNTPDAM